MKIKTTCDWIIKALKNILLTIKKYLKIFFSIKDKQKNEYHDFWEWFEKEEKKFYKIIKKSENVDRDFLEILSPKLSQINDGFYTLTGMLDENTAELIITADSVAKYILCVEEFIQYAPNINGWKFTALKPESDIVSEINMSEFNFNKQTLSFYPNYSQEYPDLIDITIVHIDMNEENKLKIESGTMIFLDNYLGELNFLNIIDEVKVIGIENVEEELIPIEKLKDYLLWRQKEFVEKYEGIRYDTEHDNHSCIEAELENGEYFIALIDTELLEWNCKASHPWVLDIEIKYEGENNNGMPDNKTYKLLNKIEDEIMLDLKDHDGYLNIGRQTSENIRVVYFACKEFRKPSKILNEIEKKYSSRFEINYDIYKDKYWRTFNKFRQNLFDDNED